MQSAKGHTVTAVSNGDTVQLTSLWETRRVVVCFLRHFGCRFCKQMTAQLDRIQGELEKADVTLIAIGIGTVSEVCCPPTA